MKLCDVLDHDRLLLVVCEDCTGKTPLDPAPFALRFGVHAGLSEIKPEIVCPMCGSAEIRLSTFSPVERGQAATPGAPDARA
jgi:hypothetical protein